MFGENVNRLESDKLNFYSLNHSKVVFCGLTTLILSGFQAEIKRISPSENTIKLESIALNLLKSHQKIGPLSLLGADAKNPVIFVWRSRDFKSFFEPSKQSEEPIPGAAPASAPGKTTEQIRLTVKCVYRKDYTQVYQEILRYFGAIAT